MRFRFLRRLGRLLGRGRLNRLLGLSRFAYGRLLGGLGLGLLTRFTGLLRLTCGHDKLLLWIEILKNRETTFIRPRGRLTRSAAYSVAAWAMNVSFLVSKLMGRAHERRKDRQPPVLSPSSMASCVPGRLNHGTALASCLCGLRLTCVHFPMLAIHKTMVASCTTGCMALT